MSNDIRSILERLSAVEEGRLTPVAVKTGLNPQQKSVDQLPALFKPRNISPTLTKKPYQKHPMDGKLVGDSVEPKKNALEEAMQEVEEDMLGKVKRDFIDYIGRLEDRLNDDGRREKSTPELDKLSKKEKIDRDLVDKARDAVEAGKAEEDINEDPTQAEPPADFKPEPVENPVLPESAPVQTVAMEDAVFEIHGNDESGYEIRHRGRSLPTRFPNIDHANMALKMFQHRRAHQDRGQDYIEEK
jgi:hypothetical protein